MPVLMAIRYKIIIGKLSEIGDERAVERSLNASIIGSYDRCRGQLVLMGHRRALQFITHPLYAHIYIHTYNPDRRYYTITCWGVFRGLVINILRYTAYIPDYSNVMSNK